MSVQTPESTRTVSPYAEYADEGRGTGWVTFAGVLLLVLGSVNIIQGIAAIDKANFFVANAHFVFGDLNTWGWVALCIGVLQLLIGLGVFVKNQFARWSGVVILCGSAIAALLMMPAYPFWALTVIALDILAVYGLVAYGDRLGT